MVPCTISHKLHRRFLERVIVSSLPLIPSPAASLPHSPLRGICAKRTFLLSNQEHKSLRTRCSMKGSSSSTTSTRFPLTEPLSPPSSPCPRPLPRLNPQALLPT